MYAIRSYYDLFVVGLAFDIAHEHDAFQGPDVGAGGDHIDGDGDAKLRIGAEGLDGFFGFAFAYLVGDLFTELIRFIEDFAHGIDDAVAVVVVFGEDEGFGDFGAAWENFSEQFVPEGFDA